MGFRLLLALVVVAIAAWLGWSWMPSDPPSSVRGGSEPPAAPAFESRGAVGSRGWASQPGGDSSAVSRLEVDPMANPWRCSGRCLEQASGAAISGCVVRAGVQVVATDADGRFVLEVTGPRAVVEIRHADHVGVRRTFQRQGASLDLGTVRLRAAGRVAGMLTDDRARPCGHRVVVVEPQSFEVRRDGWRELQQLRARTAEDGSFVLSTPLPAGTLLVRAPELPSLVGASSFALRAGSDLFLQLRCRAWQAEQELSGVVVDERGQPAAGAMLQVCADASAERVTRMLACDEDGRFSIVCEQGATSPVWLRASSEGGSLASPVSGPYRWGRDSLRLQLAATGGVWLRVVDAEDQSPIECFAVQVVATSGVRSSTAGTRRCEGQHDGGQCWLRLADGGHEVVVWPSDPRWLPNLPHAFRVGATTREVTVALPRAQDLSVRVVRDDGRAVAGATVRLVEPADNAIVRELSELLLHGGSRVRPNVVVATSRTDAAGIARVRWRDESAMQVRVHGAGMAPHVASHVRFDAGVATIRVPETGVLRARIPEAKGLRLVLAQRGTANRLPNAWSAPLTLDGNGERDVHVPVGEWQVRLAAPLPNGEWRSLPDVLATVRIAAGRVHECRPSAAAQLARGEVVGQVHVDGVPATQVVLLHGAATEHGSIAAVATSVLPADAHGAYRFAELRTGYYALQARVLCSGQQVSIALADWFLLPPGGSRNGGADVVTTAPLTIRLRSPEGAAVRDGQLLLRGSNGALLVGAPDERGDVSFARVPVTSYQLQLRRSRGGLPPGHVQPSHVQVAPGVGADRTVVVR